MPDLTEPGEAHALDIAAPPLLQPLTASVSNFAGPGAAHWKDEGVLVLYGGHVAIVNGAGEGWEDKLRTLGVEAVRLDAEHIAIKVPG